MVTLKILYEMPPIFYLVSNLGNLLAKKKNLEKEKEKHWSIIQTLYKMGSITDFILEWSV